MNDTSVIDTFLSVFSRYIDSGFGLLGGEVGFLSSSLIGIDLTLAALFWAWGSEEDVLQRLVRKTLYIGVFAWIIGNFGNLATILFDSFAGLGLKATGSSLALGDFLKPGTLASTGIDAAMPLLDATADLLGPVGLFTNIVEIAILLIGWLIVVLAFFVMAIQVFITIIEFKLVTLAGFVLLPFAFFGRTAFMAEKVLGHIVSSGIKLLVLAVITGIGTTLFSQFTSAGLGSEPTLQQVLALVLAALSLLGLAIFGPGIANGIVAGGPQLGAGAAAGTALAAGAAVGGAGAAVGLAGGAAAGLAGSGAAAAGGLSRAFAAGAAGRSGASAAVGGLSGVARQSAQAAGSPLRAAATHLAQRFAGGTPDAETESSASSTAGRAPRWAVAMKRGQTLSHGASVAAHTLKAGDSHGAGGAPDISDKS
ncbi:P-type conjugative transfer protein TrbL [Novosphingobium sp. 9]|uniref:P-type conjugative transfer protein TrbL n=1 Tax=Novosphingobium sp. 9 TaxID=2025349 RepID=UPI0021B6BD62|nr:P-type conjugative transfer protein TrbL [Novosphingobium sp. 9]